MKSANHVAMVLSLFGIIFNAHAQPSDGEVNGLRMACGSGSNMSRMTCENAIRQYGIGPFSADVCDQKISQTQQACHRLSRSENINDRVMACNSLQSLAKLKCDAAGAFMGNNPMSQMQCQGAMNEANAACGG